MAEIWHLEWPHGALDVHAKGGMLGGVALKRGERQVRPFYEPSWIGNATRQQPELLNHMRGEFPCVPFGVPYAPAAVVESWRESFTRPVAEPDPLLGSSDDLLHEYGSVTEWTLVRQTDFEIEIELEYPAASPIARLVRVVRADPKSAAIDFSLTIETRKKTHRPIGLHSRV